MKTRSSRKHGSELNSRMRRSLVWTSVASLMLLALVACETTPTQQGAVVGGALGAGAGAIIGNQSHGRGGQGALIGGALGALTGALVGDQVDEARHGTTYAPGPPPPRQAASQSGHYENRTVRTQNGETYEERVWVPDR